MKTKYEQFTEAIDKQINLVPEIKLKRSDVELEVDPLGSIYFYQGGDGVKIARTDIPEFLEWIKEYFLKID